MTDNSNYFYLSTNFLRLAHESAVEICKSDNPAFVTSVDPNSNSEFNDRIRWTDHSVGIAAIFCFYHGIELIMKGFIRKNDSQVGCGHKLTVLLSKFESMYPQSELRATLKRHIALGENNSPFFDFLVSNQLTIDQWYEALKYPEMNNGTIIDHFPLKYKGNLAIEFWKEIAFDSAKINKQGYTLSEPI